MPRALLAACIVLSVFVLRLAQTETAHIRAAFLQMIGRPRVPLAAETGRA